MRAQIDWASFVVIRAVDNRSEALYLSWLSGPYTIILGHIVVLGPSGIGHRPQTKSTWLQT